MEFEGDTLPDNLVEILVCAPLEKLSQFTLYVTQAAFDSIDEETAYELENHYELQNITIKISKSDSASPKPTTIPSISSGEVFDGINALGETGLYYDSDADSMSADGFTAFGDEIYIPLLDADGQNVTSQKMVDGLKIKVEYEMGESFIEGKPMLVKLPVGGVYQYYIRFKTGPSMQTDDVDVSGVITLNKSKKGDVDGKDYRVKKLKQDFDFSIGYKYNYNDGIHSVIIDDPEWSIVPNELYLCKFDCDDEIEFEFGSEPNEGSFTVDASGQGKLVIAFKTEIDENITAANPDADIIALNFNDVRFNRTGVFHYESDNMRYAYRVGENELVKIGEFANGEVEFNTAVLGRFIFSDRELISPEFIGEVDFFN